MLRRARELTDYKLGATDGDIGKVREFYFNDQSWTIRYLVADTGNWLSERQVLISPYALEPANKAGMVIPVHMTRAQIEKGPPLSTDRPVSRQYEGEYYAYYGWPAYWGGTHAWGATAYPMPGPARWSEVSLRDDEDPHLRSTADVSGRDVHALDGEIGHTEDFVIDDETWNIRYLIVATKNWWPGKKVLISTRWIDHISWEEARVYVDMTRDEIRNAPEFTDETLITRDHEAKLHRHYNRDFYWENELAGVSSR